MNSLFCATMLFMLGIVATTATAQPCAEARFEGEPSAALRTFNNAPAETAVRAFHVTREASLGPEPVLLATGAFRTASGIPAVNVARWDQGRWVPFDAGMTPSFTAEPRAFAEIAKSVPGGVEAGLYVLVTEWDLQRGKLMRWDGQRWEQAAPELIGRPYRMVAFDDGSGPAIYVSGNNALWRNDAWEPISGLVRWDGNTWSRVGDFEGGLVGGMLVADFDGRDELLIGGTWHSVPSLPGGGGVARWDGQRWRIVEGGWTHLGWNEQIVSLVAVDDDGPGGDPPTIFAGGSISSVGSQPARGVAMWKHGQWSPLGEGVRSTGVCTQNIVVVRSMYARQEGNGHVLYVGGTFDRAGEIDVRGLAMWNGTEWFAPPDGSARFPCESVTAFVEFDLDGLGAQPSTLIIGGGFRMMDGVHAENIAHLVDGRWVPLTNAPNGAVHALLHVEHNAAPGIPHGTYSGGAFNVINSTRTGSVARWDGSTWHAIDAGLDFPVYALALHDDGGGPAIFAGGRFIDPRFGNPAGAQTPRVARWNGQRWDAIGHTIGAPLWNNYVDAFATFDDGNGAALYAGGSFEHVNGQLSRGIARWDGVRWSAVQGFELASNADVRSLKMWNDGTGPALYAGGSFTFPSFSSGLVRWSGQAVGPVSAPGANGSVRSLAIAPVRGVLRLVVAGEASGAHLINAWEPPFWRHLAYNSAIGGGRGVLALTSHDFGSGPMLVAAGDFLALGTSPVRGLGVFDGFDWHQLGEGFTVAPSVSSHHLWEPLVAMNSMLDPVTAQPTLLISGEFHEINGQQIARFARVTCDACYADCDHTTGPGVLDIFDFLCFQSRYAAGDPYACDCDLSTGSGVCDIFDLLCFGNAFARGCP